MNKTAEEIKDQVAKKYYTRGDRLLISWEDAISEYCKGYLSELMFERIINESIEAYHTAKLEEVSELPSDNEIKSEFGSKGYDPADAYFIMAQWMRSIAQSVIANKREENQKLNDGLKYCHKRMAEAYKEISTLKAMLEIEVKINTSQAMEISSLKAEIERLKINQKYLCPHCGTEVEKEGYACERCCVRGTNTGHEFKLD